MTQITNGTKPDRVRVGLIGCGEIAQVVHIPTLNHLSHLFQITYLCDISKTALEYCQAKVVATKPPITTNPQEVCASPDVDVVFVINSDEYHAEHGVLALKHDKHVFIEKPMALNDRDADAIIEAERRSKGKVMVGYMRRYAPAFQDAIAEIGGIDKILYARIRDIIGPNATFVEQSGAFPIRVTDFSQADVENKNIRASEILKQGIEIETGLTSEVPPTRMWRALGGLGSHDLSLMREALGMPVGVIGAHLAVPFWNAIFKYPSFTVTYESGLDSVPRFDAHLTIYSANKTVRVQYDTPYIKGLPVTLNIQENVDGVYKESTIRKTYEDPYTIELKELYSVIVDGKPVKTTAEDAKLDLEIFRMLFKAAAASRTGLISSWFVQDLVVSRDDRKANHIIQAIGSSSLEKAKNFVQKYVSKGSPSVYGCYDEVYNDSDVDIVYIGIPHAFHKDECLKAIENGKHVLCEKPFALNSGEAREVFEAAEKKGVFIMEGVWTRFMPLVRQLLKMVHEEKVIGEVQRVFCDFGLPVDIQKLPNDSRLKNPALGAGSLLDIGIYSLTWGLMLLDEGIAGMAETPKVFSAQSISHGIDVATSILLLYPQNGRQGILTSTLGSKTDPIFATIEGSYGKIHIEGVAASVPSSYRVIPRDASSEPTVFKAPHKFGRGFFYEADAVAIDIAAGRTQNDIIPWEESLRVMALMDGIRERGGAKFPQDR